MFYITFVGIDMRLLFLFCFSFGTIFSFGKTGHRIVGRIAEMHLNENAKTEIRNLIGHTNIAMISNWADFIKSDKSWKHAWDWHFETVPDSLTVEEAAGKFAGKLLRKIDEFSKTVSDESMSKKERITALKFLVHLVGDLHQPLHVGNGKDKGGNSVKVTWFGEETNLHRVWDSHMIDDQKLSYTEYASYLNEVSSKEEKVKWISTDVNAWAEESKSYRAQIYDIGQGRLYYSYGFKNKKLLEKRLTQAGIRLAAILNKTFDK